MEEQEIKPKNMPANTKVFQSYLKYSDIQSKYSQDLVVSWIEYFDQIFANSAIAPSKELDSTIAMRELSLDESISTAGSPYVADNYFNKISSKHNIDVIEQ